MLFKVKEVTGVVVIELIGRYGEPGEPPLVDLFEAKLSEGNRLFLINLAGLKFINSFGLGTLLRAYIKVKEAGGQLKMCGAEPRVRHFFKVITDEHLFDVSLDCEEELKQLLEYSPDGNGE